MKKAVQEAATGVDAGGEARRSSSRQRRLSEGELGVFLRSKGIHAAVLDEWRRAGADRPARHRGRLEAAARSREMRELERELQRKDKALAEAAALHRAQKKSPGDSGGTRTTTRTRRTTNDPRCSSRRLLPPELGCGAACETHRPQRPHAAALGDVRRATVATGRIARPRTSSRQPSARRSSRVATSAGVPRHVAEADRSAARRPRRVHRRRSRRSTACCATRSFSIVEAARGRRRIAPREHVADGPWQVASWDITYLRSHVAGSSSTCTSSRTCGAGRSSAGRCTRSSPTSSPPRSSSASASSSPTQDLAGWVLHSDNGGPMKGATMLATLQRLGVVPSFSRPRVSDDNPFIEALFRTLKYWPEYPVTGFASVEEARALGDSLRRLVQPRAPAQRHRLRRAGRPPCRQRRRDPRCSKSCLRARERTAPRAMVRRASPMEPTTRRHAEPGGRAPSRTRRVAFTRQLP